MTGPRGHQEWHIRVGTRWAGWLCLVLAGCTIHEPGSPGFFGNRDGWPCPQWVSDAASAHLPAGWQVLRLAARQCQETPRPVASPARGSSLHRSRTVLQVSSHCMIKERPVALPDLAPGSRTSPPVESSGGYAVQDEHGKGQGWVAWRDDPRHVWLHLKQPIPSGVAELVVEIAAR
jgi:hypothetical protein